MFVNIHKIERERESGGVGGGGMCTWGVIVFTLINNCDNNNNSFIEHNSAPVVSSQLCGFVILLSLLVMCEHFIMK